MINPFFIMKLIRDQKKERERRLEEYSKESYLTPGEVDEKVNYLTREEIDEKVKFHES